MEDDAAFPLPRDPSVDNRERATMTAVQPPRNSGKESEFFASNRLEHLLQSQPLGVAKEVWAFTIEPKDLVRGKRLYRADSIVVSLAYFVNQGQEH